MDSTHTHDLYFLHWNEHIAWLTPYRPSSRRSFLQSSLILLISVLRFLASSSS
jgi:hypothetical protein